MISAELLLETVEDSGALQPANDIRMIVAARIIIFMVNRDVVLTCVSVIGCQYYASKIRNSACRYTLNTFPDCSSASERADFPCIIVQTHMKYVVFGLLLVSTSAFAQQSQIRTLEPMKGSEELVDRATPVELTTSLLMSDEGKAALAEFQSLKSAGQIPAFNKSQNTYEVGATALFWVRNVSTNAFVQRDFTLQHDDTNFAIWVETAELNNGHVRAEDVEAVRAAMAESTPADSYNPDQGIIDNDVEIFGSPPDKDGDGKTDLLLVDVHDNYDPGSGNFLFVAGFFDPNDLTDGAQSNQADIVYMDTMPGMVNESGTRRPIENLLQTTAHEFQHLIHANYDTNEDIWVNEAQSEWAEIELGYPGRTITYLSDVDEHDVEMFAFRSGSILELRDRERGAIVSKFFAEQLGTLVQGSVTRETSNSEDGYIDVFGSEGGVPRCSTRLSYRGVVQ